MIEDCRHQQEAMTLRQVKADAWPRQVTADAQHYTLQVPTPSDLLETGREITQTLRMRASVTSAASAASPALPVSDGAAASSADAAAGSESAAAGWDAAAASSLTEVLAMSPHAMHGQKSGGQASGAPSTPGASDLASDCSETLSDVDDTELESLYLLGEQESQQKADVWHEVNKDYLEEWHIRSRESKRRKEERSAANSAAETGSSTSRRSRQRYPKCDSAAQAAALGLTRKGGVAPNRINMDDLNSLFEGL